MNEKEEVSNEIFAVVDTTDRGGRRRRRRRRIIQYIIGTGGSSMKYQNDKGNNLL